MRRKLSAVSYRLSAKSKIKGKSEGNSKSRVKL
jgi:hypothetical protein